MANVRDASGAALRDAVQRIASYLAANDWLPDTNKYKVNCVEEYKRAAERMCDDQLEDYMVAAVPLHCMDGWAYLSRALQAQIAGDSARAVHLAYYAELRGALSILGARGVAVLDREHVVIDGKRELHKIRGPGTHEFAWQALKEWASTRDAADLLGTSITYQGVSLSDWLRHAGFAGMNIAIAGEWFQAWGADIKIFGGDRRARNRFSYRPTALLHLKESDVSELNSQLRGFWEAFEPAGANPFAQLDGALVRSALQEAAGALPTKGEKRLRTAVESALDALGFDQPIVVLARTYLLSEKNGPGSWLLRHMGDVPEGHSEVIIPGLLARAALLLRLATAAAKQFVDDGGWKAVFGFWIERYGSETGLWDTDAPPGKLSDLRADIDVALEESFRWQDTHVGAEAKAGWQTDNAAFLRTLSAAQLIGLWGLAG